MKYFMNIKIIFRKNIFFEITKYCLAISNIVITDINNVESSTDSSNQV